MKNILNFFTKSYFFLETDFKSNFNKSLILALFFVVYLFLIINNETIPFPYVIFVYIGFGLVLFITFIISLYLLPKYVFKNVFESITIYKYIIWLITTILVGYFLSYCLHCILYHNEFLISNFLIFIKQYFVLVFPIILLAILLDYISSLKNKIYDIETVNQSISSKNIHPSIIKKSYNFDSENKKESLELNEESILFVNGADNYVEIHFTNEKNDYQSKLIRSKIKTIENDLKNNFLIKVHRSYLCNLKNVSKVSKIGQNYFLHFEKTTIKIPVSLNYIENILHLLEQNQ